jgi:hypothetical protein|tara:strand:- start:95 stop:331 length:237 start_codon:yes stop_codon:yes gene_type:complete
MAARTALHSIDGHTRVVPQLPVLIGTPREQMPTFGDGTRMRQCRRDRNDMVLFQVTLYFSGNQTHARFALVWVGRVGW